MIFKDKDNKDRASKDKASSAVPRKKNCNFIH